MDPIMPNRRAGRLPAMIALTIAVLTACSQAASAPTRGADAADGAAAVPQASAPSAGEANVEEDASGGGPRAGEGLAAPIEQRIVKTGEMSVEVPDVFAAVGRVRAIALELGGYVGGSHAGADDEGATLTLRVPALRFDEALQRVRDLDGEVVSEATQEVDVTRQIVDLEARIVNLEASEASYRALLERAERIEDVLVVQGRLDEVRSQIEQMRAQLQEIEGDADLSTLTVSLFPVAAPITAAAGSWDPGAQLEGAVASLVGIGQGLVTALIWIGVVWVPVLLVLALGALLALRAMLEVRRRLPAATPVAVDRKVSGG
jgi:hypothetical protein